ALAALYPAFTRFTFACAVEKFAAVARIFNPKLARQTDQKAAEACCAEVDAFLRRIGMWVSLKSLGVPKEEVARIAADGQVLSDYKNNPRVATLEEMHEILVASYERRD
ncbi:MAG: iron-containing alcohol dehydrogenase, partial [Spirochaetes bacterium]|nr:iron-containing alcohol dehydrogenase [Spirochaetota bacterium]